jgi:hypothetical protein
VADESTRLDREHVVLLIGKHAKQLAQLASEQGCMTLYYLLQTASEHAEKELLAAQRVTERVPS